MLQSSGKGGMKTPEAIGRQARKGRAVFLAGKMEASIKERKFSFLCILPIL
jgi:hypothetical protein